jgi:5'-3' exonuclease
MQLGLAILFLFFFLAMSASTLHRSLQRSSLRSSLTFSSQPFSINPLKRSKRTSSSLPSTSLKQQNIPKDVVYILDGTAMLYRSYFGKESVMKFHKMRTTEEYGSIPCGALAAYAHTFARFIRDFKPKYLVVTFDCGKSFRNDLFPMYKQQRDKVSLCPLFFSLDLIISLLSYFFKPHDELCAQFPYALKLLQSMGSTCLQSPGFEADDIMASFSDSIIRR